MSLSVQIQLLSSTVGIIGVSSSSGIAFWLRANIYKLKLRYSIFSIVNVNVRKTICKSRNSCKFQKEMSIFDGVWFNFNYTKVNHWNFFHKSILFPEAYAIAPTRAGTHSSKFIRAIYRTCEIIVFSLRRNFSQNIIYKWNLKRN